MAKAQTVLTPQKSSFSIALIFTTISYIYIYIYAAPSFYHHGLKRVVPEHFNCIPVVRSRTTIDLLAIGTHPQNRPPNRRSPTGSNKSTVVQDRSIEIPKSIVVRDQQVGIKLKYSGTTRFKPWKNKTTFWCNTFQSCNVLVRIDFWQPRPGLWRGADQEGGGRRGAAASERAWRRPRAPRTCPASERRGNN